MNNNQEIKQNNRNKVIAMTIGGKGGIGKSICAQIARETLAGPDRTKKVIIVDSDINNAAMAQIYRDVVFVPIRDATNLEARGALIESIQMVATGGADALVWDLGAGTEDIVRAKYLQDVSRWAAKARIDVIAIRPITTSAFSQMQAIEFVQWAAQNRVATVIVKNLGQGRAEPLFEHWRSVAARHEIFPPAVEVNLADLGSWVTDEATALGLSLADVALGRVDHLDERRRTVAETRFTTPVRLAVADYLEEQCSRFAGAFAQAVLNLEEKE